jgi:glutamate formiminotransferase
MATVDPRIVQVSTNLLDYHRTSLLQLFDRVRELAADQGVEVDSSEIVGLLPTEALTASFATYLRLPHFRPSGVLENRLLSTLLSK